MREEGLQGALSKREGPYRTQFPDNYKKKGKFVQVGCTIKLDQCLSLAASCRHLDSGMCGQGEVWGNGAGDVERIKIERSRL